MKFEIWANLMSPDHSTAMRYWILIIGKWRIKTHIQYYPTNRIMMRIERWLARKWWKHFDVSW